jgi:hypothetical protein
MGELMRGVALALALLCAACSGTEPGYQSGRGSFSPAIGSGG